MTNIPPEETRFKPGQSGNPAGRPKGLPNSKTILNKFLALEEKVRNPVTGLEEQMSQLEIIYLQQIAKARKGDLKAMKEIMDRLEGRAQQSVDHTTQGDKILPILGGLSVQSNSGDQETSSTQQEN